MDEKKTFSCETNKNNRLKKITGIVIAMPCELATILPISVYFCFFDEDVNDEFQSSQGQHQKFQKLMLM